MGNILTLTEAAATEVKSMMEKSNEQAAFLRVSVQGGGCSGLSYGMGFDHEKAADDTEFDQYGIKVLVDKNSEQILQGVVIDFKQSMMGGGFTIENPNAVASCGCGSSFRTATNEGTPDDC